MFLSRTKTHKKNTYTYIYRNETVEGELRQVQYESHKNVTKRFIADRLAILNAKGEKAISNKMTFGEVYEEFLAIYKNMVGKGVKQKTLENFICMSKRSKDFFWDHKISEIKHRHCQEFINKVLDEGLGIHTLRITVLEMKKVLKYAIKNEYIETMPIFELPRTKKSRKIERNTPEEIKEFLKFCDDRLFFYTLVMFYTGMRRIEFHNLECRHLDFENRSITVEDSADNKRGSVKPMIPPLYNLLYRYKGKEGRVSPYTTLDVSTKSMKRASIRSGIDVTPRKLRKTHASILQDNKVDGTIIGLLMGHIHPGYGTEIAQNHYLSPMFPVVYQAVESAIPMIG